MSTVARERVGAMSTPPLREPEKRGKRVKQKIVVFLTPAEPERLLRLYEVLDEIQDNISANPGLSFPALEMVHYASFVVLEDPDRGPELLFESNIDGELDAYLDALLARVKGIHEAYKCCEGYKEAPDVARYLTKRRFRVKPRAWHIGNTGRSRQQIRDEAYLRAAIEGYVQDHAEELAESSPQAIRETVQDFVNGKDDLRWGLSKPPPRQTLLEHIWRKGRVGVLALALLALVWWFVQATSLGVLLAVVGAWAIVQLLHDWLERPAPPTDPRHVDEVTEREDLGPQNHFASVVAIKRSPLRRLGLEIGLWIVNLMNKAADMNGNLHGIPSIHFAHWSVIEGRRFLFLTNYDGSWGAYLDDFVHRTGWIMTAVWSNCVGFPRTWLLFFKGARDAVRLKDWGRGTQVRTRVWYSAYPRLTVAHIDDNSALRKGLSGHLGPRATRNWVRRL